MISLDQLDDWVTRLKAMTGRCTCGCVAPEAFVRVTGLARSGYDRNIGSRESLTELVREMRNAVLDVRARGES